MNEQYNNNDLSHKNTDTINITQRALEELLEVKKKNNIPDDYGLRIGIKGGGCSGFAYTLGFDGKLYPTDHVLYFGDLKVYIDMKSYLYLPGATLDYKNNSSGTGFIFDNPNVKITCGCGSAIKK